MPNTIEQNLARLQAARAAISTAITAKGGTVSSGDGLEEFTSDIATIPTGSEIVLPNAKTSFDVPRFGSNWSSKTWSGLTSFQGKYIWTDGTDIYYSYNELHYVLGKLPAVSLPTTKCVPGYIG